MNRDPRTGSAAIWIGSALAALFSVGAVAAESSKSKLNEASTATLQQRLEAAQRRLESTAQEIADLNTSLSRGTLADAEVRPGRRSQRAVLGVNIGTDQDGRRSDGVQILSVTPGSGAYEAGLKSGDLLLSLNNKALKRDDDGSPREKLLALMRGIQPGEKVAIKYRREGFTKTVDLIARPLADRRSSQVARPAPVERVERAEAPRVVPETPRIAVVQPESILGSSELVPLTPTLGRYFGTDKGLLVVRAPEDESLDIQEGDVILDIDGRTPDSTSHAMRILSSYQPGEELTLNVLRRKRRFEIDVAIPDAAPRARLEQRQDRSPRANDVRRPRARVLAPAASDSAGLAVQPLPDEEVEIDPAD